MEIGKIALRREWMKEDDDLCGGRFIYTVQFLSFDTLVYVLRIYFENWMLTINVEIIGIRISRPSVAFTRFLRILSLPHWRRELEGEQPRCDTTTSVKVGSKASFGASFRWHLATVDEKITGEIHSRATETVARGRKEGRKEETRRRKRTSEREARAMPSSFLMRIRRKSWRSTVKDEMKGMRDTVERYIRLARTRERAAPALYPSQYSVSV